MWENVLGCLGWQSQPPMGMLIVARGSDGRASFLAPVFIQLYMKHFRLTNNLLDSICLVGTEHPLTHYSGMCRKLALNTDSLRFITLDNCRQMDTFYDMIDSSCFANPVGLTCCIIDGINRIWAEYGQSGIDQLWRRLRSLSNHRRVTVIVIMHESTSISLDYRYFSRLADVTFDIAELKSGPSREADGILTLQRRDSMEQMHTCASFLVKFSESGGMIQCSEIGIKR